MTSGLTSFVRLSRQRKALLVDAAGALVLAVFLIRFVPFSKIARRLGTAGHESSPDIPEEMDVIAQDTSWAIAAICRRLRIPPSCLVQATAAKSMLGKRGISATVYFGVAPNSGDGREINAHAWLRCGKRIVTGKAQARRYKPLAWFG